MNHFLSQRLRSMEESQTMAMNQKTRDLQAQGLDIINLTAGEPDFYVPDHIKEAAKNAIDNNYSFYTPVAGYADLRKAIAEKLQRDNGLHYAPEQIVVSNGAKHALANAIMSLVDVGDEVIIPAPYWVSYSELVKLAGGKNVIVHTSIDNGFKMTADQLQAVITEKTKLLILCSPSNPSGAVYSTKELQSFAQALAPHKRIFVLSDEIYEYINFSSGYASIAQCDACAERTVIINGLSKAYAMTGYRIGYLAAPQWIAAACAKLQGHFTANASSIAQRAALSALTADTSCTNTMVEAFLRRRNLVMNALKGMPNIRCCNPDGAFYVFPDVSAFYGKSNAGITVNNDMDMCLYLLEKALTAAVPGSAFGESACIRLSYATSDENLLKAMKNIKNALAQLA